MALDDRALLLQRELFFRVLSVAKPPVAVAKALAQSITDVYFEEGSTIFQAGDEPSGIYFIVEGKVTLDAPGEEPWTFERGGVVGILDVNLERPRARTATARTYVHAMLLKGEDWIEILEDNFEYSIQTRRAIAADLHAIVLALSPTGGFVAPDDHDEAEVVPEMNAIARLVVLRSVPAFREASVQALASVASDAETVTLEKGESLFDEGSPDDCIYLVAAGIIELERRAEPVIRAAFGPSTLVGGPSAFGGVMHEYRARARTSATVLRIYLTDLDDVAEDHFDLTRSITKEFGVDRERLMLLRGRRRSSIVPSEASPAPDSEVGL